MPSHRMRKLYGIGVDQMFAQWPNILNFLMYLGVTLPLLGVGIAVFLITTPYREFQLIRDGADTTDSQKMAAAKEIGRASCRERGWREGGGGRLYEDRG